MHSIRHLALTVAAFAALWLTPALAHGATAGAWTAAPTGELQDGTAPDVTPAPGATAPEAGATAAEDDWQAQVNRLMGAVNNAIGSVVFFPLPIPGTHAPSPTPLPFIGTEVQNVCIPFAVLWLILGAIFFTVRMGFPQLKAMRHAIDVVRGRYDDPQDAGDVTSFQALSAALSATVGLGNIAGVAVAIGIGGPGATFWMIVAGFLGMASKFTECTLGQMYRQIRPDGTVMGGAMHYLSVGLAQQGKAGLGKVLAMMFAVLCIGGSIAGGNSFQVSQSLGAVRASFPGLAGYEWVYGAVLTVAVGVVIIGGIRRIADVASKIVPTMCVIYVLAALFVILSHAAHIPAAFGEILAGAFSPSAMYGGVIGVLIVGFKRAAFSNEAGVGSAAIAHSAAKTPYPVREGIVALLEPFIDTVVICTMTALVIVVTESYDRSNPAFEVYIAGNNGAALTSLAFKNSIGDWFTVVLSVAVVLFAFSTMISWSYYGERCWSWLFGERTALVYKLLFLTFTFLGSILTATNLLEFGDLMILAMAIPNVLGVVLLSGKVRASFVDYWAKLKSGQMPMLK